MAFTVEDGTNVADANAYITVAEFRAYWTDRAIDYTAVVDATVQGYIVQGTQYIDGRYSFKGEPTNDDQELLWPRMNNSGGTITDTRTKKTVLTNVIPDTLKNAMCEIVAIINDKGTGNINNNIENNIKSESVGPISISYGSSNGSKYGGSNSGAYTEYRVATNYIKGILTTTGIVRV